MGITQKSGAMKYWRTLANSKLKIQMRRLLYAPSRCIFEIIYNVMVYDRLPLLFVCDSYQFLLNRRLFRNQTTASMGKRLLFNWLINSWNSYGGTSLWHEFSIYIHCELIINLWVEENLQSLKNVSSPQPALSHRDGLWVIRSLLYK